MEKENEIKKKPVNVADHLANERTFLSWIRTSIAVIVFGFVLVRFNLFVKQIHILLRSNNKLMDLPDDKGYSNLFGIVLICLGTILPLMAFLRYKKTVNQIYGEIYKPSLSLSLLLTISIILIGILLVINILPW